MSPNATTSVASLILAAYFDINEKYIVSTAGPKLLACKRHVGSGFTRKENLAEHLRRVHRDAGADQPQAEGSESVQNQSGSGATVRKRRRAVADDDGGDEEDLEQEVKKLKKQLQEKDERLEKLERQVQLLVRAQKE